MAIKTIDDSNLVAIADAIREKNGLPGVEITDIIYRDVGTRTLYSATPNIDKETGVNNGFYPDKYKQIEVLTIPNAESLHVKIVYNKTDVFDYICAWQGKHPDFVPNEHWPDSFTGRLEGNATKEYDITGDSVTIGFSSDGSSGDYGYWATVTGMEREIISQNIVPINTYKPNEMGAAILGIKDHSKEIHIGPTQNLWFTQFLDHIPDPDYTIYYHPTFYRQTSGSGFSPSRGAPILIGISFQNFPNIEINSDIQLVLDTYADGTKCSPGLISKYYFNLTFEDCALKQLPEKIIKIFVDNGGGLTTTRAFYRTPFKNIDAIYQLDNGWLNADNFKFHYGEESAREIFYQCTNLERVDCGKLPRLYSSMGSAYNQMVYEGFCDCFSLEEALNIWPPNDGTYSITSNSFVNTFNSCYMLKRVTFAPDKKQGTISNQVLDLSKVGYGLAYVFNLLPLVDSDETYAQYKNEKYRTSMIEYCHYNHTSAVETINSLPEVDSGTVKFTGAAGSKTDGGAINTLTDAEIAIATDKGWTVSLL